MSEAVGLTDVAKPVGLPLQYLRWIAGRCDGLYRSSEVPKKSGGVRIIRAPKQQLKVVQRRILDGLLVRFPLSAIAYGGVKGRSDLSNAALHVSQPLVCCFDIRDFYPNVSHTRVLHLLSSLGFRDEPARLLTRLITVEDQLPQGAPTSTYLGNLVLKRLDERLTALCAGVALRVSRFVDDITVSGACDPLWLEAEVDALVRREGFELKREKFQAVDGSREQVVTGFQVNTGVQARSEYVLSTAEKIDEYLSLEELEADSSHLLDILRHLHGRIAYIGRVSREIAADLRGRVPILPQERGPSERSPRGHLRHRLARTNFR